jgi:hypothetical protein
MPSEAERLAARPLCEPCRAEWGRWLDYYQGGPLPVLDVPYGYSATPKGVEDRRRYLAGDRAATIRWQQEHIERLCAAAEHVPWPEGQLELFPAKAA